MSDLDFASIPLDQPLPQVENGFRMFAGEVLNAIIYRLNNGSSVTIPVPINQGGTGEEDAPSALLALGGQPLDSDLTAIAALATTGLAVRTGAGTWANRSLTAPAAGMTISNGSGIAGDLVFAFTGNLLALVGLAGTGIAVQTGAGTWAQRTLTAGTGISISNGDGVAGNPTAAINLAASLTWTGIPNFSNGVMVSDDGVAIGAGGATDALIYQPAADQLAIAVGASTFTFSAASLSLNGNAFLTAATAVLKANNLSDLASATTALTNLGLSANAKSFVTAANYAAMRTAISLVPGTDVQTYSAVLATIAGLAPTNSDFLQYTAGAWANRTPTQATATLIAFVGDSGGGGAKGLVPAPAAGDAAASKYLKADGTWASPAGSGDVVGPAVATTSAAASFDGTTGKLIKDSKIILTIPAAAATLTLGSGKTVTISNTLTFTGTDGSTLAIGAGGTLTALAFTAPGVGVATALGVSVGSPGAVVVNGGALGTPSSGTLSGCTGLPVSSGISGLGANIATFLATPSSANLIAAMTDETGTGALVFATSPTLVTPILGTPTSGNLSNCTVDGTTLVGFRSIPQQSKSANFTTILSNSGQCIYHPASDANARTFTIDSNANVAYPLGTVIEFINRSANNVTIAITADTLIWSPTGGTGSRTLAQYGVATAQKIENTEWVITGTGLT